MAELTESTTVGRLLEAKVMHQRLLPRRNGFRYGVYYLALAITDTPPVLPHCWLTRLGLLSFHSKDHGYRDERSLRQWIEDCMAEHSLPSPEKVVLVCMPRVLGYVFNPVSFWLCQDSQNRLRAVVCEVNNTFGETHCYVCAHAEGREITTEDWLKAEKLFHVSPFLEREGEYKFCFHLSEEKCDIRIDYSHQSGSQLATRVWGNWSALSGASLTSVFLRYPLVTLKTIGLIHYQALKIALKGIRYIPKPKQRDKHSSRGE